MARNRKYRSAAIRFGPALKAFLLCLLIGGAGVGYVWQKDQISRLEREIQKRESHLAVLAALNEKQQRNLAAMRLPRYLQAKIKDLNLGLVPPQPAQIWRIPEPPAEEARPVRESQLAADTRRVETLR